MKVGVIKEIKDKEHRVALTPAGAKALHKAGHTVLVQAGAGLGAGFSDAQYGDAGAHIVAVEQAWDADLVLKVKEPLAAEYPYLQEQILCFTPGAAAGLCDDASSPRHRCQDTDRPMRKVPRNLVEQPHASHTGQQHKQAPEALCPWVSLRVLKEGFLEG